MSQPVISRRQARRDALIVLYQHDISGAEIDKLLDDLKLEYNHPASDFTREEVEGVMEARSRLDSIIDKQSSNWPSHRLAALERNILRLAIYEITEQQEIPVEVSIDEAVSLAKRFSSQEAGKLVNGILGKIAEGRKNNG